MTDSTADAHFVRICEASAIPEGACRDYKMEVGSLLVCHAEGGFYAIADVCTHDGAPLGDAELFDCEVECPRHGARFDIRSGKATALPAVRPVATYAVRVVDGFLEVQYRAPEKPKSSPSRGYPFGGKR